MNWSPEENDAYRGAPHEMPDEPDEIERLRAALAELVACETDSAGWTPELLSDDEAHRAFLARQEEWLAKAVRAALHALGT